MRISNWAGMRPAEIALSGAVTKTRTARTSLAGTSALSTSASAGAPGDFSRTGARPVNRITAWASWKPRLAIFRV